MLLSECEVVDVAGATDFRIPMVLFKHDLVILVFSKLFHCKPILWCQLEEGQILCSIPRNIMTKHAPNLYMDLVMYGVTCFMVPGRRGGGFPGRI